MGTQAKMHKYYTQMQLLGIFLLFKNKNSLDVKLKTEEWFA